jgi:hypothetical protein
VSGFEANCYVNNILIQHYELLHDRLKVTCDHNLSVKFVPWDLAGTFRFHVLTSSLSEGRRTLYHGTSHDADSRRFVLVSADYEAATSLRGCSAQLWESKSLSSWRWACAVNSSSDLPLGKSDG